MKNEAIHPWLGALHLAVLASFALAQPLYDILGRHPAFLVAQRVDGWWLVGWALLLSLGIPALLAAGVALFRLIGPRSTTVATWSVTTVLSTLILWPLLRRLIGSTDWILPLGIGLAILAAECYRRSGAVRSVLTVLIPAVVLFPILFFAQSDIARLAFGSSGTSRQTGAAQGDTPVVVVVLDELPTTTLLDSQGRIDALRFPNFARLAGKSHWFRNATTVSASTILAVPSILDGRYPKERDTALPTLQDHPDNLFTLLAPTHRLVVSEVLTQLAPEWAEQVGVDSAGDVRGFARDTALVYLHLVLPPQGVRRLPPLGGAWTNFGADAPALEWKDFLRPRRDDRVAQFESFIGAISARDRPSLYFLHVLLPHSPWVYLPDGRTFVTSDATDVRGALGANDQGLPPTTWVDDEWTATQAWQRHILQTAYVDGLLGRLMDRMKEEGLFERSLLALVADHGVSFRPGDQRRDFSDTNRHDLMPVPLMVKLPGQSEGQTHTGPAEVIDLLPTIAAELGLEAPTDWDGRPLLSDAGRRPTRRILDRSRKAVIVEEEPLWKAAARTLNAKLTLFGDGDWAALYRIGPSPSLLQTAVSQLRKAPRSKLRLEIENRLLYRSVDASGTVWPTQIGGRLDGGQGVRPLALALNGVVEAVTFSSRLNGFEDFAAVVPPSAIREGANRMEVFEIVPGPGGPALALISGAAECTQRLVEREGRLTVVGADGRETAVMSDGVTGWVHAVIKDDVVTLGGWTADLRHLRPASRVLIFLDGECVDSSLPRLSRSDVVRDLGEESLRQTGFRFTLAAAAQEESRQKQVRLVALTDDGAAGELHYPPTAESWPYRLRPRRPLDPVSRQAIERLRKKRKASEASPSQD